MLIFITCSSFNERIRETRNNNNGDAHGHLGSSISGLTAEPGLFKTEAPTPRFRVTRDKPGEDQDGWPFLITDHLEGALETADCLLAQGTYHPRPVNAGEAE